MNRPLTARGVERESTSPAFVRNPGSPSAGKHLERRFASGLRAHLRASRRRNRGLTRVILTVVAAIVVALAFVNFFAR